MNRPILLIIADILNSNSNKDLLSHYLGSPKMDWDNLVKIGSEHLLLPSIYCKLYQRELLNFLPVELKTYLNEISELNKERNQVLIREIKEISDVLSNNNINHVFIKGAALLVGDFYSDFAERMVGDIDILIDQKQIEEAFNLLIEYGYTKRIEFNYDNPGFRHLPRIISENKLGSIELHTNIINYSKSRKVNLKEILDKKIKINNVWIPNPSILASSIVYSQQINNNGYLLNNFNLKYLNDILVLDNNFNTLLVSKSERDKYIDSFKFYLNAIFNKRYKVKSKFLIKSLRLKIQIYKPYLHDILLKIQLLQVNISKRVILFVKSSEYRENIIKSLFLTKKNTI